MKSSLKFRHTCKSFKLFKPAAELINSMKSVDWTKPSAENLDQIRELGNKLCNELNGEQTSILNYYAICHYSGWYSLLLLTVSFHTVCIRGGVGSQTLY